MYKQKYEYLTNLGGEEFNWLFFYNWCLTYKSITNNEFCEFIQLIPFILRYYFDNNSLFSKICCKVIQLHDLFCKQLLNHHQYDIEKINQINNEFNNLKEKINLFETNIKIAMLKAICFDNFDNEKYKQAYNNIEKHYDSIIHKINKLVNHQHHHHHK